jgi:hypothetical protein
MQPVGPANTMILTDYPQKCFQIIGWDNLNVALITFKWPFFDVDTSFGV